MNLSSCCTAWYTQNKFPHSIHSAFRYIWNTKPNRMNKKPNGYVKVSKEHVPFLSILALHTREQWNEGKPLKAVSNEITSRFLFPVPLVTFFWYLFLWTKTTLKILHIVLCASGYITTKWVKYKEMWNFTESTEHYPVADIEVTLKRNLCQQRWCYFILTLTNAHCQWIFKNM